MSSAPLLAPPPVPGDPVSGGPVSGGPVSGGPVPEGPSGGGPPTGGPPTRGRVPAASAAALALVHGVAAEQHGVVTRQQVLTAGVSPHGIRQLLARGEWWRSLLGCYLVEPWRTEEELRWSRAAAAVLTHPGAVVGLTAAAQLHGLPGPSEASDRRGGGRASGGRAGVDLLLPPGASRRDHPPVRTHRRALAPGDVVDLRGLPVTGVLRTLVDLVPRSNRLDALVLLDAARRSGAVDEADLALARARTAGHRGCRGVADLWALADPRAESPLESRVRLRCLDAGLVPDALQLVVRDEHGHPLARADLAFTRRAGARRTPLLLEADGASAHDGPEALHRDRRRQNALVALGHDVIRCTWADTLSRSAVPAMVRAAL